jgi:hypothetical protein
VSLVTAYLGVIMYRSPLEPRQERRWTRFHSAKAMLTYHYALISNPCERTITAFLEFVRSHPRYLLTLTPEDSRAARRAIARAGSAHERPFAWEDGDLTLALQRGVAA